MSAPYLEPAISVSSSGHTDGLGRRELCFDRETGAMLERLHVRPELAAFETAIRERLQHLAVFEDRRFARAYSAERIPTSGELTVVSEFVSGIRLADLLESAAEETLVPGLDAALGYLVESLSALGALHQGVGFPHGLVAPDRTVFTADGRLVFLDPVFAAVVDRLGLSRRRLWTEFGLAAAPGAGPVRLDAASDLSQAALIAVMLILGRRLDEVDYPDNVPSLLMEVVEVAQIRGTTQFASGLQRLLQRMLPLPGRRPYATAEEALTDLRQLIRREIGVDVCQKALVEFIRQLHPPQPVSRLIPEEELFEDESTGEDFESESVVEFDLDLDAHIERPAAHERNEDDVYELSSDDLAQGFGNFAPVEAPDPISLLQPDTFSEPDLDTAGEDIDPLSTEPSPQESLLFAEIEAQAESAATDDVGACAELAVDAPPDVSSVETSNIEPEPADVHTAPLFQESEPPVLPQPIEPVESVEESPAPIPLITTDATADEPLPTLESSESPAADSSPVAEEVAAPIEEPAPEAPPAELLASEPVVVDAPDLSITDGSAPSADPPSKGGNHRRKRHQQKSARARKDKLRSTTKPESIAGQTVVAAPAAAAAPAPAPSKSGWLIPPEKTAKFETSAPDLVPTFQPAMVQPPNFANAATPPPFSMPPQPVVSLQPPVMPLPASPAVGTLPPQAAPMPRFGTPVGGRVAAAAPPAPVAAAPVMLEPVARIGTLKVKTEPPAGYVPAAKPRRANRGVESLEPVAHLPGAFRGPSFQEQVPTRGFPWKLTVAVVVLVAAAVLVGRAYLPGGALAKAPAETPTATLPPAAPDEAASSGLNPTGTGQIVIKTEPAGARVLLDGKAAGESPLTLNGISAGRHVLTFVSSSGSVKRTVKVVAGKSVTLDVPIFSGWVSLFAPFVVDVAEDGRSLGTTEQGKIMLAPGHHRLTLTNADMGYRTEQDVEVTAGEVSSLRLEPTGQANFNAIPWAEVWSDGRKVGDTPIANHTLPLGTQEFTFKHPQFGERKVSATIRAGQPAAVVVDFTKPQD